MMGQRSGRKRLGGVKKGFKCIHCGRQVLDKGMMGTHQRNHCTFCLWSKHVDLMKAGDRRARCGAGMRPVGLTFKRVGVDKRGKLRQGELMVVHECTGCGKISINRIAGDDEAESIERVFEESLGLKDGLRRRISEAGIKLLAREDREEVRRQLWGRG